MVGLAEDGPDPLVPDDSRCANACSAATASPVDTCGKRVGVDLLPCGAETLARLIGDHARWTNPAAMMDSYQSVGRSPGARKLRLLADDLAALLNAQPHPTASADDDRARLYARTATGLLRYHHRMADPHRPA